MNEVAFYKKNRYLMGPKIIQIEITTQCPLRCPQCFIHDFPMKHMAFEQYMKHIEDGKECGLRGVVLFGGEPLCHPQIIDFIDYAYKNNIHITIYTSGWGINDELCHQILIYKDLLTLFISLNGSKKEVHNRSREGYNLTVNAMRALMRNEVPYSINWVSREDNVKDLPELRDLAQRYNAQSINIVSNKISSNYMVESPLSRHSYELIVSEVDSFPNFYSIENCNALLKNLVLKDGMNCNEFSGCTAGISSCSITIDGEYVPCLRLLYKEQFDSLKQYWKESKYLSQLREIRKKRSPNNACSGCKYIATCNYCKALSRDSYNDFDSGIKNCVIYESVVSE